MELVINLIAQLEIELLFSAWCQHALISTTNILQNRICAIVEMQARKQEGASIWRLNVVYSETVKSS